MINREELERVAEIKALSLQKAEKDYVLEWLLFIIYKKARTAFVFKGGTALYKAYGLNRFSEDLDFTLVKRKFNVKECFDTILRELSYIGLEGTIKEFETYPREINARLTFKAPLYDGSKESLCFVSANISLRERPLLEMAQELLTPLYKEIPAFEVYVLQPEELLAEKVRAILTREKARDVYDMWFLLKRGTALNMDLVNKKLWLYKLKFEKTIFLKRIATTQKVWQKDLAGLVIGSTPNFEKIEAEIIASL